MKLYYSEHLPSAARPIIKAPYYPIIFLMGKSEPFEKSMEWYVGLWLRK